jgi:hypothetical protein
MTKAAELAKMGEVLTNSQIGGRRNIIINGAMQVAQRGTSSTGIGASAGYFTLDRFRIQPTSTAGRLTMEQVADVHDGFANALKLTCTTADTSIAAGERLLLHQKIEGQDLQQLKKGTSDAEEFTVSFYVKGNASATYVLEIYDLDNNRQISKTFSVTTSWNRVILTFPADTTGAYDNDNAASIQMSIFLHAGSTYTSGTLNSSAFAANNNANRAVGISSFFDSTDRTFFITGLQMEVGSQATPFEHRSFGEELQLCQRYFEKSYSVGTAPASDTSAGLITTDTMAGDTTTAYLAHQLKYRVAKRSAPTVTIYDQAEASGKVTSHVTGVSTANGQTISTEHAGDKSISVNRPSGDAANGFRYHYTADAEL